jgi:hypothetical protein
VEREETLAFIAFTLNHIWLQDHRRSKMEEVRGKKDINLEIPMAVDPLLHPEKD